MTKRWKIINLKCLVKMPAEVDLNHKTIKIYDMFSSRAAITNIKEYAGEKSFQQLAAVSWLPCLSPILAE